jgi:asparagine synthase (glutamine-hydrolysing)
MCGVVALYAYSHAAPPVDRDEVDRMRDHMAARGPDAAGTWVSSTRRVALGHRRLAIIDLSSRGVQPMHSGSGRYVISFNGEIYNYRALRIQLEARGFEFASDSDTEVVLHLYADRGSAMLRELRGMFAFAIWDEVRAELFVARDPYGIKPLYYADDGRSVRVASQVKALTAGGGVGGAIDHAGIAGFYLFGSVPEPFTCYREIRALEAGTSLTWGPHGVVRERHFSLAETLRECLAGTGSTDEARTRSSVRAAVRDSVAHHLVADVPVGAFLSSGIDSSAIVGLMRELNPDATLETVTLTFEEFRNTPSDEAPLAQIVAAHYRTRHTTRVITAREFRDSVPQILAAMDQPSVDGINTWFVSKATRECGLKVAVSGLGGDELFAGYPNTFGRIPRWVRCLSPLTKVPHLGRFWQRLWSMPRATELVPVSPKVAGLLLYGGTYAGAYFLSRGLFMPWELGDVMGVEAAREGLARLDPLELTNAAITPDPGTSYGEIAALEGALYLKNQLLRDSDWASMAHSLELRVPLVDAVLLRRVATLVHERRGPTIGKTWLADSVSPRLPAEVLQRPKTGFTIPVQRWLAATEGHALDAWRGNRRLRHPRCHWSRRLAYALVQTSFGAQAG